ncbi:hypothetical protein U9M48_003463, partial [Paspalum notatum var. saurae]
SHRIEVLRITEFTNPSAGSMMWQGLPVKDEVFWPLCQAGRPGGRGRAAWPTGQGTPDLVIFLLFSVDLVPTIKYSTQLVELC